MFGRQLLCRPILARMRFIQWSGKKQPIVPPSPTSQPEQPIVPANLAPDTTSRQGMMDRYKTIQSAERKQLGLQQHKFNEETGINIVDVHRDMNPYRKVNETEELRKLWQLQNLATMGRFNFDVPVEEQKTVRIAVIGRTNCGKSTLINRLIGRPACPVANFNDATQRTSIHAVQQGNIIYEFVDLPGVPDTISPDGVGEYTFRRRNIERAKLNPQGNHSLFQTDNANFATNDLFIKNCDVILVCADLTSRMTIAGNLTINVYQLLARNPHIPAMLVLTKSDLLKYRTNYKFQNIERKNARMLKLMDIVDKMTEGHLAGQLTDAGKARFFGKPENVIQMKPTTIQIEESGLEQRRPMRIRKISSVRQIESILRLTNSWRWNDLNRHQQRLYNMGNRGWRYFESIFPISMELPQTLNPIFEKIGEKALLKPWVPDRLLEGQLDPLELIEENLRMSCLQHLQGKSAYAAVTDVKHIEVNGTPSKAEIRAVVDISYDLQNTRFMSSYKKKQLRGKYPAWLKDTHYCERNFERNMIKVRNTMEGKIRAAFNAGNVQVNLNFVRYDDQKEPIVEIAPTMDAIEAPINPSFKQSFPEDKPRQEFKPEKYYTDDSDYHFMDDEAKENFLKRLGKEQLEKFGLDEQANKERSERAEEHRNRKYGFRQNQDRFKNKKYGD